MYKRNIFALAVLSMATFYTAAGADEKLCEVYAGEYDGANREMARIVAEGILDNSAPRETARQLELLNERLLQLITMQQMEFHGCDLPKIPSGSAGYFISALNCKTKGEIGSPECDTGKWKSTLGHLEHFQ